MEPLAPPAPPPPSDLILRVTTSAERAREWSLVLESGGIPHEVVTTSAGLALMVPNASGPVATRRLAKYDAEAARDVPEATSPPQPGSGRLGTLAAMVIIGVFAATGPEAAGSDLMARGAALSERILGGQPWRVVTALTLHGDLMHVAANALACFIFVAAVGRWLGGGFGALLVLATGAAGNFLTALWYRTGHASIGASTATFGALGLLAGLQFVRRLRGVRLRRRAWIALGAALALFAMLGVGEHVDVAAHLFGLVSGVVFGFVAGLAQPRVPRPVAQAALAAVSCVAIAAAWALALR